MRIRAAALPLILINVLIYLAQINLGPSFTQALILQSDIILNEPWRLITSMFVHSTESGYHIFFNMFALLIFGPLLEARIGPKKFLTTYFASGLVAGLTSLIFYDATLGASGAIMGMIGTLIILMPNLKLLFFFIIPMPLWVAGLIWASLDIFGFFSGSGNVANAAHLGGLIAGIAYGLVQTKGKYNFKSANQPTRSDDIILNKKHLTEEDVENYIKNQN